MNTACEYDPDCYIIFLKPRMYGDLIEIGLCPAMKWDECCWVTEMTRYEFARLVIDVEKKKPRSKLLGALLSLGEIQDDSFREYLSGQRILLSFDNLSHE